MQLKPKIGIGNLKFGMTQKDILEVLGIPNRKRIDEDDDEQILLEFNQLKLRLTFYLNEGNRLGYLRTTNVDLTFNGHKIIGTKVNIAKKMIFGSLINDWEIDEYDFFITHSNDEFWITLNEEFGEVIAIELGVTFSDEENYDWPT
jgi:hypothetical protein